MSDAPEVVLVTGAGRGIGAAVATAFARQGAHVAALDVDGDALAEMAAHEPRIATYPADVSDSGTVEAAVDGAERTLGPITTLVNVAGILRPAPVLELSDEDWQRTLAVNATGVFVTARAVARRMVARRAGAIVTVASNAAGVPRTRMAAYAASKAAAVQFTLCLGLELAADGIRCNVVSPGSTDTPMQRALWPDPADDGGAEAVIRGDLDSYRVGIPLGRLARPADIADAVCFLASERAAHITMQNLYVDGGATLRA